MKMTGILEKDKDRLLTELGAAGTAEKAVKILEKECDKLLLTYNERCGSDAERDAAAHLMQAVRLSLPMMNSTGSTKVWERGQDDDRSQGKAPAAVILLTIAGIVLCAFGLIPLVMLCMNNANAASRNDILIRCASVVLGIIAIFLSGSLNSRPAAAGKKEYQVEIRIDADRIYRYFRTVILSVDQSLEETAANEKYKQREMAGTIDGRPATTPEIELFSDLLAASYSGDPEYALEKIDDIKYYLHKQQIEIVDYSEKTRQYFDLMPGSRAGTIRPAMIADGKLLKKGLASSGR